MSVALTVPPLIRPFRGFPEPQLPDGYWVVHASALGDLSGGVLSVNIRFSAATEPNPSTLWNLEQLAITAPTGTVGIRVDYGNMDFHPIGTSTGSLSKLFTLNTDRTEVSSAESPLINRRLIPVFLGQARKDVSGDLSFDVDNADGVSLSVLAQGFFWGPGAINAPGGPQRPLTSLFG